MICCESITLTSPGCDSVGDAQSLSSPSGADQWEAQDGCWNGQQRLGVPLWESRKMLCIESAGRRPPAASRKPMPHIPVKYISPCSQRAVKGSLHRGAGRQRRSKRLRTFPYDGPGRGVSRPCEGEGDRLRWRGSPLQSEGYSKRCCQSESVAAERRI